MTDAARAEPEWHDRELMELFKGEMSKCWRSGIWLVREGPRNLTLPEHGFWPIDATPLGGSTSTDIGDERGLTRRAELGTILVGDLLREIKTFFKNGIRVLIENSDGAAESRIAEKTEKGHVTAGLLNEPATVIQADDDERGFPRNRRK